ncbi:hypothetical protein [Gemmobacter caeni]|uniref:hypothetical protein n=1 Tax=Gemmobacter caeni TaxID=589035 RepID=UPI000D3B5B76|nr:hypothetical protein [Gemmobacter caeni]
MAGVPIAEITHGQMPIIADHAGEILALAARVAGDTDFARILNYARIQRAWCGWGLVPGSISDEISPFNACSHAWLAATRELILRMDAAGTSAQARDLARRIDAEMLMSQTALDLCAYSASPYDTAGLVRPVWADVLRHPASLGSIGGVGLLALALAALALRWLLRPVSAVAA